MWFPPRAGILMDALLGFRWVWPDAVCYPSCDPSKQANLLSEVAYTY